MDFTLIQFDLTETKSDLHVFEWQKYEVLPCCIVYDKDVIFCNSSLIMFCCAAKFHKYSVRRLLVGFLAESYYEKTTAVSNSWRGGTMGHVLNVEYVFKKMASHALRWSLISTP